MTNRLSLLLLFLAFCGCAGRTAGVRRGEEEVFFKTDPGGRQTAVKLQKLLKSRQFEELNRLLIAHPEPCASHAWLSTTVSPLIWSDAPAIPIIDPQSEWHPFCRYLSELAPENMPVEFFAAVYRNKKKDPSEGMLLFATCFSGEAGDKENRLLLSLYLRYTGKNRQENESYKDTIKRLLNEKAAAGAATLGGVPVDRFLRDLDAPDRPKVKG